MQVQHMLGLLDQILPPLLVSIQWVGAKICKIGFGLLL